MAKRWTKQEDEILGKFIEKGKLPKAISEVSASLGRTEAAVYVRYLSLKKIQSLKEVITSTLKRKIRLYWIILQILKISLYKNYATN